MVHANFELVLSHGACMVVVLGYNESVVKPFPYTSQTLQAWVTMVGIAPSTSTIHSSSIRGPAYLSWRAHMLANLWVVVAHGNGMEGALQ